MRKRVKQATVPPERELADSWQGAAAAGVLTTTEGTALRVVYPGRRNLTAGPDFLDAIIETADGEVRGAVEVHRHTSDWERHGHSADPRYAAVVLHVVGRDDGAAGRLPGGTQLPLLELDPAHLAAAPGQAPDPLPCVRAIARGSNPLPALKSAGDARFQAAVDRLRGQCQPRQPRQPCPPTAAGGHGSWEQLAYRWLAEALGYSRNREPLGDLAAAVPLIDLVQSAADLHPSAAALTVEAFLLGAAGLLPSQRHLPAARRRGTYVQAIEDAWTGFGKAPALRAYRWDFGHVRPENAPVRRVVALAHLALRWPREGLLSRVHHSLAASPPAANRSLARLIALPCPAGYWADHWDFGVPASPPGTGTAALIGPSRAADAVVNVLLPLAAAGTPAGAPDQDHLLAERARAAYHTHGRLAENWITRLVRERTGLAAGRDDALTTARAQQGLLAIYEGPCHSLHCSSCPLNA